MKTKKIISFYYFHLNIEIKQNLIFERKNVIDILISLFYFMEGYFSISNFFESHSEEPFFLLLMLMVVIWTAGRIFSYVQLPMILGEILAGIVLGPSVLGLIEETETIKVLADLGIFFMMFHAGLDTDIRDVVKASKGAIMSSLASIVSIVSVAFGVGIFFPGIFVGVSEMGVLFIGLVLAAASFPIIMRVLRHFKLKTTKIGKLIMASAIFTELLVFIGISILLSLYSSGNFDLKNISFILLSTIAFFLGTLFLGKVILPWFRIFLNKTGSKAFTFSLIIALVFGLFAEFIGLHFILGAYLGGMFVREEIENEKVFGKIEDRYFGFSYSFLGPVFFATVGLSMSIDIFDTSMGIILALVGAVSVIHLLVTGGVIKFLGKYSWKNAFVASSALLGRGAAEVVLIKIGFEAGVFGEYIFSLLIAITIVLIFVSSFLMEFGVLLLRKKI